MREALQLAGVEESDRIKMPRPLSSVKSIPLPRPDCLNEVSTHLSKSPVPFVGLQVHSSKRILCVEYNDSKKWDAFYILFVMICKFVDDRQIRLFCLHGVQQGNPSLPLAPSRSRSHPSRRRQS